MDRVSASSWAWPKSWILVILGLVGGCSNAPVSGLAVPELVLEAPEVLDLGTIPTDEPVEARFEVINVGQRTVELEGVQAEALPAPAAVSLTGQVEAGLLPPGARAEVRVQVIATARPPSDRLGAIGLAVAGYPDDDPRLPLVEVIGIVSASGLAVEPNPVTIGPVPFTETGTGGLVLRNVRRQNAEPVNVYAMQVEDGRAAYDEALSRGAFGPLPEVDADGRLATLGPGETFPVELSYTAPNTPGEAKEQAVWSITTCPNSPQACAVAVIVQGIPDTEGPQLRVNPGGVHFGPTPVGERVEQTIAVVNQGQRALVIRDVGFSGSPEMTAELEEGSLEPGRSFEGIATYLPTEEGLHNAELRFATNDPLARDFTLRISGSGVVLPPCRFIVTPNPVTFGELEIGEEAEREVTVRNEGTEECVMFDPRIVLDVDTDPGTFIFSEPPRSSVRLGPGEETSLFVRFAPRSAGRKFGVLRLRTSGDSLDIPLRGETPEGAAIRCSSDQATQPERAVTLNAVLTAGAGRRYDWRVVSAPPGDGGPSWLIAPDPPDGPSADLTPLELGTYEVEVAVETEEGETLSCRMFVTAESTGLQVVLTWDGAGDLDLHLQRGDRNRWYTDDDCYFENMRPEWVRGEPAGAGPNPRLDRDDTSGDGPENIRISTPEFAIPYTIGVSHFERAAGRTAKIEVFCGRVSSVLDVASRPFRGQSTGTCSSNDFWSVATVTFFAPDRCQVDAIDTYQTTLSACP